MCLCVCVAAINITRPRFSGNDEFGYTSFAAYSPLPSLSLFYEFRLQFTLASGSDAAKDNLVMFAGHKGQGERPPSSQELKPRRDTLKVHCVKFGLIGVFC